MSLKLFFDKLNRRDTRILPKFSKTAKFLLISLITITLSLFAFHALAQTNVIQENIDAWKGGGNLNTWLGQDSLKINSVGVLDALTDIKDAPPAIINGLNADAGKTPLWIPGGLIGSANNTIASVYSNPPASGIQYLAQMKDEFLGKPAYAQGVGFQGLQPLLPVWRAFRNVIYILSSLIFIIIGVMIMLRVKISPQAVINIQNAIPQLITALILVTFSYAIAGLIVDLMYVLQGLALAIIFNGVGKGLADNLLKSSIVAPFSTNFASISSYNLGTVFWLSIKNLDVLVISSIGGLVSGLIVGIVTLNPITGAIGLGVGTVIFLIIICVFVLFLIIKFLFGLIKCYITLIIKIVLAPLEIGMGAFPNSKMGFSSWIMDVLANILVFPISLIFLVLVNVIAESSSNLWVPNIITVANVTSTFVPFIIAFGGLMLLPKLPEMIPQFVFMLKPSPWGQAIGEGMKPENLPVIGGIYSNTKAAAGKAQGEAVVDAGKAVLNRFGIGAKTAHNEEKTSSQFKE